MSIICDPIPDISLARKTRARFMARSEDADLRFEQLSNEVGQAKGRLEDEPEVIAVLETLQSREHQRAVGAYEQLLSLLLQDVLPGERQVVLDLRTERGLPALDVFLRKGKDQPLEDALHGTGGSVTNLLSAGLRFIALIRSGQRPFLILDEADCWIKPALAARFAGVVRQMADELGVQVIMISHHDDSLFEPVLPHRLRLEVGSGGLSAHWAPTSSSPTWAEDQRGLRSIELMDFQSHKHTVLPLSPGVTLIQGDNDIGKSAVVKALRAAFYAESNDTFIKHGASKAKVMMDFGPENILTWERNRKGRAKVVYSLTQRENGATIHQTEGARDVPPWVINFGIATVDELDIQLGDQHDPVFLLNKSPRERAKALAVGDEASHVQSLLALDKQEVLDSRAIVRQGEKSLENIHRLRAALEPIRKSEKDWAQTEEMALRISREREAMARAQQIYANWTSAQSKTEALRIISDGCLPTMPTMKSNPSGDRLLRDWGAAILTIGLLDGIQQPEPELPDPPMSVAIDALMTRWSMAHKQRLAIVGLTQFEAPQMPETSVGLGEITALLGKWLKAKERRVAMQGIGQGLLPEIIQNGDTQTCLLGARWEQAQKASRVALEALAAAASEEKLAEIQVRAAFPDCPVCHQAWHGIEAEDHTAKDADACL